MICRPIWLLAARTALLTMVVATNRELLRAVQSSVERLIRCKDGWLGVRMRWTGGTAAAPALRPFLRGPLLQFFVGRFAIDRFLVMAGKDR